MGGGGGGVKPFQKSKQIPVEFNSKIAHTHSGPK